MTERRTNDGDLVNTDRRGVRPDQTRRIDVKRLTVSEFVLPSGLTEAQDRWRFPYRSDEMGECGCDEPGVGTDG
jgi:hypothetical protein